MSTALPARALVALVLVVSFVALAPFAAVPLVAAPPVGASIAAAGDPRYRPPTPRPVVRSFDVGPGPYAAGNRGLDYGTSAGDSVTAIGDGTVVFAGPVAGVEWVTVAHPDGLRSSLGPLAVVAVEAGREVRAGDLVGTASGTLHLGVRRGSAYLDPASLFAADGPARLIPVRVPAARWQPLARPWSRPARTSLAGSVARFAPNVAARLHSPPGVARSAVSRRRSPPRRTIQFRRRAPPVAHTSATRRSSTEGKPPWPQSSP